VNISEILGYNPTLEARLGRFEEFLSAGPVRLDDELLLTYARNPRFVELALSKPNVAVLFARPEDAPAGRQSATLILTGDPEAAFFRFHNYLATETSFYGTSQPSLISPGAEVHPTAYIAEWDVRIEAGATVGPNAMLLEGTALEAGARVGPGAVLGVDGARFAKPLDGERFPIVHIGGVLLREGAYVGANSVVARSVWRRPTTIGRNAYVGNLANVGHNCMVGDGAMVLPGAVLCGTTTVEEGAVVSPGAVVANQKRIGRKAWVTLGAVVTKDVEAGSRVSGNFAIEHARLLEQVKKIARE
jgi:UDP-3-O-[3-hydroxymyristoyl] glucosamine N-acyltransferase